MFEEDFERCFICQAPSKGLYCSVECRQQDKGSDSPMTKGSDLAPVRLTAQLPASLSPMIRPAYTITPSPKFGGRPRGTSTSSSSLSESPIHSPHTNPSGSDSPQKEVFNLPPPAYPTPLGYIGSVPVKIPSGFQNRVPSNGNNGANPAHSTTPTTGASIDTLRFGRKSSVTNSVTSPLALAPRCGCGRALGHRNRNLPGDDANIACLNLGPGGPDADVAVLRMVSDPIHRTPRTPNMPCPTLPEERSISHVLGSSLLSRSRSDPHHPPSPRTARAHTQEHTRASGSIHPRPALDVSLGATPPEPMALPSVAPLKGVRSRSAVPAAASASANGNNKANNTGSRRQNALDLADDRRGRSRERVQPPVDMGAELPRPQLQYHENREVAPSRDSRSRGRNVSRSRDRERTGRSRSRLDHAAYALSSPTSAAPPTRGRTAGVAA